MFEQAIILDACALLNLYASDYLSQILNEIPSKFYITEKVRDENIYIRTVERPINLVSVEPISLDSFIEQDMLTIVKLDTSDELKYFVSLAAKLDDGEAETIAKALVNKMQIITDDRKAIRIITELPDALKWLTSLDLIKMWAEMKKVDFKQLAHILQNIHLRANYFPVGGLHAGV